MFVRITSIIAGSQCESKWSREGYREIAMDWAKEHGLFDNSRWMHSIKEGETLVLNVEISAKLPEIASGNFTYEEIVAKYMNQTLYSDTNAFEVLEWLTPKKALIRELKPKFKDGEWHESTDEFEKDPDATPFIVRMHKNGGFYESGSRHCPYIPTEHPHYYYDMSF